MKILFAFYATLRHTKDGQDYPRRRAKSYLSSLFLQTPAALFFLLATIFFPLSQNARGEETDKSSPPEKPAQLTLVQAVLCEDVKELEPKGESIVFSVKIGDVVCFTSFDPVPEKTEIYHNWFKRDQPDAKMKLVLKPPKWSTFSRIRIRNEDTGPWRVEITDEKGKILKILRFSVTE